MRTVFLASFFLGVVGLRLVSAAISIPSDGSDGALVINANTVIDLSQAVIGNWDANNSANVGRGIYDPAQWAVVFKYSSVTVNSNCTLTFKNHASRAPVVWLVSGDVTIKGTVSLDGQSGVTAPSLAEPGPGGYRGATAAYSSEVGASAGFGPGGGSRGFYNGNTRFGSGGSYGSTGGYYNQPSAPYGNPSLIPLVGGSGGGVYDWGNGGGGAGGGAILIASAQTLTITGKLQSNGGTGGYYGSGGSGGGIRCVSETLSGNGVIQTLAGSGGGAGGYSGGLGRIRIERRVNTSTLQIAPDPSLVTLASNAVPQIWLPTNGPTVQIVSIGGIAAPADPRAEFGAVGADTSLPKTTNTIVIIETKNVEQASVVKVRATPRSNGNYSEVTAALTQVVSEDPLVIRWTANVPVNSGYSAMQVRVVRP